MDAIVEIFQEVLTARQWIGFHRFMEINSQPTLVTNAFNLANWYLRAMDNAHGNIKPWVVVGRSRIELIINRLREANLIDDQGQNILLLEFTDAFMAQVEKGK